MATYDLPFWVRSEIAAHDQLPRVHSLFVGMYAAARAVWEAAFNGADARTGCDAMARLLVLQDELFSRKYDDGRAYVHSSVGGNTLLRWFGAVHDMAFSTALATGYMAPSDLFYHSSVRRDLADKLRNDPTRYWGTIFRTLIASPIPDVRPPPFLYDVSLAMVEAGAAQCVSSNQPEHFVEASKLWPNLGFDNYRAFKTFLEEYGVDNHQKAQRRMVHAAHCLRAIAEREKKEQDAIDIVGDVVEGIKERAKTVKAESLARKRAEK